MNFQGKTILYLVTEDWYFWSHRLPFARAARDAGARVIVAARMRDFRDRIATEGFTPIDVPFDRSGIDPLHDVQTVRAIIDIYRAERPDLVHHVAMKPTLYGGIAVIRARDSSYAGPKVVNAMAGMGFMFISQSLKARLLRPIIKAAFRSLNRRAGTRLIVQNSDDRDLFVTEIGVPPGNIAVIRGSGVDIDRFAEGEEPDTGAPVAVCVSRMLWDKGIGELVEAARILKSREVPIVVRLVGPTDANPASIPQSELNALAAEGIVEVLGSRSDIPKIYADSHIAVLPSYREGLPKSLLEAAACGLPVVATDVPGCREICRDGETGIRVPLKTVEPLADALEKLARDGALRARLGAGARRAVEQEFAERIVVGETLALYDALLNDGG